MLAPWDVGPEEETIVVLPYMVIKPRDMKAQRKERRQGKEAEMREKPSRVSCQATTGAMSMLVRPSARKLK